ncbi:hypothetical protein CO046_01815 [Candidatus Peregrinibacteria bacterium CG_4_9_14_0_2_um_filter_53_11]|nr:MAG: hypothetical protein CO046_01815 [Candidatus Peregrinibacteria bacterium CG_4_9_14_0_2_um_filter_53_11]
MHKLSVKGLGLASGVLWGVGLFLWTLVVSLASLDWGRSSLQLVADIYPYFDISVGGAFLGLVFGFIDGWICGSLLAWLYNKFS